MRRAITRRRFIGITAAAAGLSVLPFGHRAKAQGSVVTWHGVALGAVASMQIHHPDRSAAERLIARSVQEVRRLERVFSLYRDDSVLVDLNRRGVLDAPPAELVELLAQCRRYAELTKGAFDPSVQPLWVLYAGHFFGADAEAGGPAPDAVAAARTNVGFGNVLVGRDRIAFKRRGMALTLNGIAQGYITDRVVALLRSHGVDHSLVDMGESRALGARPDGFPWEVGIADPDQPARIAETLRVVDQAVATSGGYGFCFDAQGRFNHLFDPRTGLSPDRYRSVTAVMPTATAADALSTAFSIMPVEDIRMALKVLGHGQIRLTAADGRRLVLDA
jgi:thiamine biosynthesis lipoprotein